MFYLRASLLILKAILLYKLWIFKPIRLCTSSLPSVHFENTTFKCKSCEASNFLCVIVMEFLIWKSYPADFVIETTLCTLSWWSYISIGRTENIFWCSCNQAQGYRTAITTLAADTFEITIVVERWYIAPTQYLKKKWSSYLYFISIIFLQVSWICGVTFIKSS